jgi:hypothetical protein
MATLCKHGLELYRYDDLTNRYSYRSDGNILRDYGTGWKLWKKTKTDMGQYVEKLRAKQAVYFDSHPHFVRFRELLHRVAFKNRWRVLDAIKAHPNDPDGVFSEVRDIVTLDDCLQLCRTYQLVER